MGRKGVSWGLVLPPPPPASSEVFRSPCGWGMHSWSLLHAGPETPWIDENSPPLGIFVKMLGGQEQETEVVADVETGPEPLHPQSGRFMLHDRAWAPSLRSPTLRVSGIKNVCFGPEEYLLPEVCLVRGPSLSLSSEAIWEARRPSHFPGR